MNSSRISNRQRLPLIQRLLSSGSSFPVRILTVAVIITLLLFTVFGLQFWNSYRELKTTQTFYLRLQELVGIIVHYDEILTMSARMGAATGNLKWEERYREYEPQLDATIKETIELSPEIFMSNAAIETNTSNIQLVTMENRAFKLIRQGQSKAAMDLLSSEEYERHKVLYSKGMEKINSTIQERIKGTLQNQRRRSLLIVTFAVITMLILLIAWFAVVRLIRMYVVERKKAEEDLRESHSELEKKVADRTADLQFSNKQLKQEISQRKEAEQQLIVYQKQLKSLTAKITLTEEQDRQRFASFLHDEIGQQLFAVQLQLEILKGTLSSADNIKTLNHTINNIKNVITHSRSLTSELSSPILHELGLEKALEWLTEQAHKKYDITVTFNDDKRKKPLDDAMKIFLYQAVRELLVNVAKHARTKTASISIKEDNSNIHICVKDNGVGFDFSSVHTSNNKTEGFGLFHIKEQLDQLEGHLTVDSKPNLGTQITLIVPLESRSEGL